MLQRSYVDLLRGCLGSIETGNHVQYSYLQWCHDNGVSPAEPSGSETALRLPPFLGELGLEVRYFLGAVEPWLRSGWVIPARRPEFYPHGAAYRDDDLFKRIDAITAKYRGTPMVAQIALGGATRLNMTIRKSGADALDIQMRLSGTDLHYFQNHSRFERELKDVVFRHIAHPLRPPTQWDDFLSAPRNPHQCPGEFCSQRAIVPSYRPASTLSTPYTLLHVGCQMRKLAKASDRNSESMAMMQLALRASRHLGLPVVIYGPPEGTLHPELDGVFHSHVLLGCHHPEASLLTYELALLKKCRLMIAPDSGWADLMAWLQIPTLVERQQHAHAFAALEPFRPRLKLHEPDRAVGEQIDELLATQTCYPAADDAEIDPSHLSPDGLGKLLFW